MTDTQSIASEVPSKQWTLMFFFASDNALSPSVLPQLKAIKAAGSQANTNVLVYFDPNERGAPTRVFRINHNQQQTTISDDDDQFISILASDYISPSTMKKGGPKSQEFAKSLSKTDRLEAFAALGQFLGFCHETFPADHYMLFLVGHGLVVGRDAFLPDDNPDSAIGLKTLGTILNDFKGTIGDSALELIGMHSCSMSAVEVAYELKGTAKYMLGSQGLSFVGSWPYRQLLGKIYHEIGKGAVDVDALAQGLHSLCIKYSVDFMHAGYSSDMCLCSLAPARIRSLSDQISLLARVLEDAVGEPRCRDLILLAHWKSQSYWQESYTDLYDFCLVLSRLCKEPKNEETERKEPKFRREYDAHRRAVIEACGKVMEQLKPANGRVTGPIVRADYVGPDVQYSHGLSIYFPWSKPLDDENNRVMKNYEDYTFITDSATPKTWLSFLCTYFAKTRRPDRVAEEDRANDPSSKYQDHEYRNMLVVAQTRFPKEVSGRRRNYHPTTALEGKVSPPDSTGGGCACASSKNYSRKFTMSPGVASVFADSKLNAAPASSAASTAGTNPDPAGGNTDPSRST